MESNKIKRFKQPTSFYNLAHPLDLNKEDGVYLCGGAVKDLLNGDEPVDYDLFGQTVEHLVEFENKYLSDNPDFKCTYNSDAVVSYTSVRPEDNGLKIQLVYREGRQGTPEEIITNFPFVINQFAFDGVDIITTEQAMQDNKDKVIRLNNVTSQNVIDCIVRIAKYSQRGYILAISSLNQLINVIKQTDYHTLAHELNNSIRVGRCGQLREEKTRVNVDAVMDFASEDETVEESLSLIHFGGPSQGSAQDDYQ